MSGYIRTQGSGELDRDPDYWELSSWSHVMGAEPL